MYPDLIHLTLAFPTPPLAMVGETLLIIAGNALSFCLLVFVLMTPTRDVVAALRSRLRLHLLGAILLVLGLGGLLGANIHAHELRQNSAWGWPYPMLQMFGDGWRCDLFALLVDAATSFGLVVPAVVAAECMLRTRRGSTTAHSASSASQRLSARSSVRKINVELHGAHVPAVRRLEKFRKAPRFTVTAVSALLFAASLLALAVTWQPWRLETSFKGPLARATAVALDSDGTLLACGFANGELKCWSVPDDRLRHEFFGHTAAITALSFSKFRNCLASHSSDGEMRVWDKYQGSLSYCVDATPRGGVQSTEFATTGDKLVAFADNSIQLINPDDRTTYFCGDLKAPLSRAVFVPEGDAMLRAGRDGKLNLVPLGVNTLPDQAGIAQLQILSSTKASVNFYSDAAKEEVAPLETLVAVLDTEHSDSPEGPSATDASNAEPTVTVPGTRYISITLYGALEDASEAYVTTGAHWVIIHSPSGKLTIWNATTGRLAHTVPEKIDVVSEVCCSADGKAIEVWDGNVRRTWSFDTGRPLLGHTAEVTAIAFTPNGELCATAGLDGMVRIWDLATTRVKSVWSQQLGTLGALAISADGAFLYSAGEDGSFHVRDIGAQREICVVAGDGIPVQSLCIAPDCGGALFVRKDGTVRVCNADAQIAPSILSVPSAEVTAASFGLNHDDIVVGCRGGAVQRWTHVRHWPGDLRAMPEAWIAAAFGAVFALCFLRDLWRVYAARRAVSR